MTYHYKPTGVCAKTMDFEIDGTQVKKIEIVGGCPGNSQGVAKLCENQEIDEIISRLEGIKCGFKNTSCPDQIAQALIKHKENEK